MSIQIFLLGRFEVIREGRVLRAADWTRRKASSLLQRLALQRRLLKDEAIEFLWPDADSASGANNLYRTLHSLRQTLDQVLGLDTAEIVFAFEDGVLSLSDSVWVDAREFEKLAVQSGSAALQTAVELYVGKLLPDDLYAEWTLTPRDTLQRLYRQASFALAAHHREQNNYPLLISLLIPLLVHEPADEQVHRELMRAYVLAGRRHEALRQYQTCVEALAKELDVPPEPETAALYSQILGGELVTPLVELASANVVVAPTHTPFTLTVIGTAQNVPLVGRKSELENLQRHFQAARAGRGQTILIAGDTGVGKTRLAFEILKASASAGMTVLFGAAYEQEGQLAYQPFVEAFNRHLAERRLSSKDPNVDASLGENPITHFKRQGSADPQQEQWAMFNATAAFITQLAVSTPLVFFLDDLHAADEASLRLFHFVARQTRTSAVILLATYRADMIAATTPFGGLLNALYREHLSETVNLTPLVTEPVTQMMAHVLKGEPSPELIAAVYEITEGNAFFVQEITQALLQSGQVEKRNAHWHLSGGQNHRHTLSLPTELSGLLREQVVRLGSSVESALTAASVIGREFEFEILRGTATLADSDLLDALDSALAGRLLEETVGGYRFRHPLIRQVLYDSLSRTRRERLHGLAAARLETVYARRPGGLDPHVENLAYHYEHSDRREHALEYLIQAGRKAARLYAYEVAVKYYEGALALLDVLEMPEAERRFKLLESLGKYYKVLADTPKAVAAFDRALQTSGDNWKPKPSDRARIRRLAAMGLLTAGQLDQAAAYLQMALAEVDEQSNATELANVLYNVSQLHWHRNEYQQAFEVAQRSLAVAERLNDPSAVARAFEMLALACHSLGEWQSGILYEQRRAELAGPALDVTDAFDVHL